MSEDMDEVINEFLVESYEGLDRLDTDLVDLEAQPDSHDVISSIFRTMHTIKGTCGFLGYGRLEAVAHAGENLLSQLRDRTLEPNGYIIDALLATVDAVRHQLQGIERTGAEPDDEHAALRAWLRKLQEGEEVGRPAELLPFGARVLAGLGAPIPVAAAPEVAAVATPAEVVDTAPAEAVEPVAAKPKMKAAAAGRAKADDEATAEDPSAPKTKRKRAPRKKVGEILVERGVASQEYVEMGLAAQSRGDARQLGEILISFGVTSAEEIEAALQDYRKAEEERAQSGGVADSSIRVDVGLLDTLMNLIGELVLARNQIVQLASVQHDGSLLAPSQRLNQITSELQEGVMKTRMQPIGSVWQRLPRVVRDLAVSCNKRVRLQVEGAETELDRTILEAIKDPLTHLVRNAVDHGLETPDERLRGGKDAEGMLLLRAYHESGKVNIEITDDGRGMNPMKIRAKAIENGLLTPEAAQNLSDREVLNYIFAPGFSTAEAVTNISGRGVGMDVVRTNVEKIGGAIELSSELGYGTTFRVKIPLTLAIIPALVVLSRGQRYAVPQVNLSELVRLEGGDALRKIEFIHGAPVYRLRGRLLPIVDLTDMLRGGSGCELTLASNGSANIVVVQADDHQFGLIVDSVFDTQEIVVKPLSKLLKDAEIFAGATVMGDGKIALILDALGVARRGGLVGETGHASAPAVHDFAKNEKNETDRHALVIVDAGGVKTAVKLADIARLEQFSTTSVESSRGTRVVQYRDHVMTLIDLADAVPGAGYGSLGEGEANLPVLVLNAGGVNVGVAVNGIVDIVEAPITTTAPSGYVIGTTLVNGKVTDVVDAKSFVENRVDLGDPEELVGAL
jgi:two-component system chemotaxis sensor kinase CheA